MGEISLRSRPRKDLAASFNRLRRMVADVKSARKSLAAHHSILADLVSVSLFSAVPSSKPSSPRNPPNQPQLDELQEVRTILGCPVPSSAPPSRKQPAASVPRSSLCSLQLHDLQDVGITNLQVDDPQEVDDLQEAGITASIPQVLISSSIWRTANSTLLLPASRILASSIPSPSLPVCGSSLSPLSCKNLEEADSLTSKIGTSFCQLNAVNPGNFAGQAVFRAALLFVFLCFFLFIGKEVAVGTTITAYVVRWLTHKGHSFSKRICRYIWPGSSTECHSQDKESLHRNRSFTFHTDVDHALSPPPESHFCIRSQSLPTYHGCAQEEAHSSKPGGFVYSAPSFNVRAHFARLKLGMMFALALCGLAHGQIMAICMCSCCVLLFSEMQRLAFRDARRKHKASSVHVNDSLMLLST